jgi:hypothetical protein
MAARAIDNYHTIADTESVFVLAGFPAVERLAIEKTYPAFLLSQSQLTTRHKNTPNQ